MHISFFFFSNCLVSLTIWLLFKMSSYFVSVFSVSQTYSKEDTLHFQEYQKLHLYHKTHFSFVDVKYFFF